MLPPRPQSTPLPPSAHAIPMTKLGTDEGTTTAHFISNLSVEFKSTSSTLTLRERLTILFNALQNADPTFKLLPFDRTGKKPNLVTATNFPLYSLTDYVSEGKTLKTGTKYHVLASSASRINALKQNNGVMNLLRTSNIWLRYHTLSSKDITSTGWIFGINPEGTPHQELYQSMCSALNQQFTDFQLVACNVSFNNAIKTRAWVLKMDKQDAKQWFKTLLQTFPINGLQPVKLVPLSAAAYARENSIKKVFLLHNRNLREHHVIRIDNLRGLDKILDKTDNTRQTPLRQSLLDHASTTHPSTKLFTSVSQYNSGRVTLLVCTSQLDEALHVIDYLLDEYLPTRLTAASLEKITFPTKKPIRIGRPSIPDHIALVAKAIHDLETDLDIDDEGDISVYTTPPPSRFARSHASVTAASTTTHVLPSTTPTRTSELTNEMTTDRTSNLDRLLGDIKRHNDLLETNHTALESKVIQIESTLEQTVTELGCISTVLAKQETTLQRLAHGINSLRTILIKSPQRKIAPTLPPAAQTDTTRPFPDEGSTGSYSNSELYDEAIYDEEIKPPPNLTNLQ